MREPHSIQGIKSTVVERFFTREISPRETVTDGWLPSPGDRRITLPRFHQLNLDLSLDSIQTRRDLNLDAGFVDPLVGKLDRKTLRGVRLR
ncbi:hypothetical protein EAI_12174 [Harpegnathos saltator]|uniref:Uncharacterized protein n=1 Tax=Harpegnathos saltator TaxID=610380 RepID=E2BZB2_HARSA|nr:hypothetical protein EAI_12174 [Harpegnathos saltator]